MKKLPTKKANTILEFAVVILIVAGVIAASMSVSKTVISSSEEKITKDRMEVVYSTIKNYVAANKRLPCPALISVARGSATYGNETGIAGACAGNLVSGNMVYGMVPINSLGLNADMAEDGFGTKFSYVVDRRFTKISTRVSGTDGFELTKSSPSEADVANIDLGIIDIQSPSGTSVIPNKNGIFVLISHGANKFGGHAANGTTQNPNNGTVDETSNNPTGFDRIFISSSSLSGFDDIMIFKTKAQLVRDAELKNIMCNKDEASNSLCPNGVYNSINTNWGNADYGTEYCFLMGYRYCKKTCGEYGVWSSVQSELKECGSEVAPKEPPPTCSLKDGDDYGNQTYTGGAPGSFSIGSVISLTPKSSYCGSPTITCLSTGLWSTPVTNSASACCKINDAINLGSNVQSNGYQEVAVSSPIAVACQSGFNGNPAATCTGAGTPGTANVTAGCVVNQCSQNFSSYGYQNVNTVVAKGGSATINCASGYNIPNPYALSSTVTCNTATNPTFSTPSTCHRYCSGTIPVSVFYSIPGIRDGGSFVFWNRYINCSYQSFKNTDFPFDGGVNHGSSIKLGSLSSRDGCLYYQNGTPCGCIYTRSITSSILVSCNDGNYSLSSEIAQGEYFYYEYGEYSRTPTNPPATWKP